MSDPVIRKATASDIEQLIQLRVEMQKEVKNLTDPSGEPAYREATRKYFHRAIPTGEFVAWVADVEGRLVAANGLVFYEKPPSARGLTGRIAYVSNVYTVPKWRNRGLATVMMKALVEYSRAQGAGKIHLSATDAGKAVYERVGFTKTRFVEMEMQFF